jgi:hypothetical protein
MYHCAQNGTRQLNPTKAEDGEKKQRDRRQMITFDCKGWLFITVDTTSNFAFVKLQHELDHVPYHQKEVPAKVKEYVVVNPRLTVPQVNSSKFVFNSAHKFLLDLVMGFIAPRVSRHRENTLLASCCLPSMGKAQPRKMEETRRRTCICTHNHRRGRQRFMFW